MGIAGFLSIVLLVSSLRIKKNGSEAMSIDETKTINGFFVLGIFLGHASQYIVLNDFFITKIYMLIDKQIGQLCVATFLLFSGYGVMESIKSKKDYIRLMPRNRLLPTYVTFVASLVLYLIVNIIFSIGYDLKTYILSLFAIDSIGNSNWYIFTILCMYAITYILGKLVNEKRIALYQIGVSIIFIILLKYCFGFPSRFYSTVLCYSIGLLYSVYKESIDCFVHKHMISSISVILILIGFTVLSGIRANEFGYNLYAVLFALLIICGMNFFTLKSKPLQFLGKHCFSIYLLQRVTMIFFINVLGHEVNEYLFILCCLILTILISIPFEMLTTIITNRIKTTVR